jgi:hypothetical protein
VAGGVARAMGAGSSAGGGGSSASSAKVGGSDSAYKPTPAGQVAAPSVVPHFASGALISAPTLAMIGDSSAGGSAREAVLPLDDSRAMDAIAGEIASRMGGGMGGGIHVHVKGMISSDNLRQVVRKISRDVGKGNVRLNTTNSYRITKRS